MLAPQDDEILLLQIVLRETSGAVVDDHTPPFESRHMPRLAMSRKGSPGTGVRARLIARA
jgi:hypothetical protein